MLSTFIEFILFYLAIGCNFFLQPWEDNFDFLLFCLVKLLFLGSYWAKRISTGFSLKDPVLWGRAYSARTTVCSVTVLLWEQSPSVWTVVKVSLAQPEGGEREAKKAMGHLCTSHESRNEEQPKNNLRSLWHLHKHVLCHDGSPSTCELSTVCIGHALANLCIRHFGQVIPSQPFLPANCLTWWDTYRGSTVKHWLCWKQDPVQYSVCGILQNSVVKIQKAHKGSTRNSAESDLFQSMNTATWATLVTIRM